MSDIAALKQRACAAVDRWAGELIETADWIHAHPELGHHEHEAARRLAEILATNGATVEMGTAGMETAFKAVLAGSSPGPTVAVLAEYDALPQLGHGCGHNLIATSALGAGLALTDVLGELAGSVWVLGTPAEESAAPNAGGKVHMIRAGTFDGVDASIMFHPAAETTMTDERSLAARGFEFFFHGKAAHAAGAPEDGINALDAVVSMYNAVSMLRQQVRSDVRIHGIILSGGAAANIIPDYAAIRYRTRSDDADYLEGVVQKVVACAEGAARATGCRLEWNEYLPPYENTVPNRVLMGLMKENLEALGVEVATARKRTSRGSTDFGNVTRIMPGVEARIGITESWDVPGHSIEFQQAAGTDRARQAMLHAAKALAMTAIDLLARPDALAEAKATFAADMGRSQ
jgi:amidohydrolase